MHDLLVIGGGINGTAIARDVAGRGASVLLVEADDLASHTSSASTKLIHGGLRYLEMYDFRLVREALVERDVMLHAAPHLIYPLRFVLPQAAGTRPGEQGVVDDEADVAGIVLRRAAGRVGQQEHVGAAVAQQPDQLVLLTTDLLRRVRGPRAGDLLPGQYGMDAGAVEVRADIAGVPHGDALESSVFGGDLGACGHGSAPPSGVRGPGARRGR